MHKKLIFAAATFIALQSAMVDAAHSESPRLETRIVGSWTVSISSPTGEFAPLKGVYSFTSDGVLIATDVGQLINPTSTAGQGAWKLAGGARITLKWINFAIDDAGAVDGKGVLTSTLKIADDGESFVGPARFVAYDSGGNLVFAADEILQGRRVRP